jgi:hypothetical protein
MPDAAPFAEALSALTALTSQQILGRLADLATEEAQLRALLRVARARERTRKALTPHQLVVSHEA